MVVGILLNATFCFQVHNHFPDFETDPVMMDYLEKFEEVLENENKGQLLRMLLFACAEKVKRSFLKETCFYLSREVV